jgi:hypothetical protein
MVSFLGIVVPILMHSVEQKSLLAPKGSSADIYKIPVGAEHLIMPPKFIYMLNNSILCYIKNTRQICCVFTEYKGFVARTSAVARTGPIL